MKKVLTILNELKNENIDSELLLDESIINQNQPVKGISKLELMGGEYPMRKDFLNIDLKAKTGIKGSVLKTSQFIESELSKKKVIIINNPYCEESGEPQQLLNDLFKEINNISGKGSYVLITGTLSNKFFKGIKNENKDIINELKHWDFLIYRGELPHLYKETEFYRSNGKPIKGKMKMTLLKKK
ncbi:MAG: hypothetical protein DRR16_30210 [Candidatus Parabeggiatoa sp. nov. 3]|nr:MAG: hypothetical protein DRR00_22830 [Gammaproteobacteria bacterium]RKZ58710.1 MAG: hypothetical protein DRQ99_24970 [Gammaproteobacteria bacterium]RKZ76704.1 MAG: hypothetical protein DRR16_30210 [Gammaproteobacteria bacterium]